MSDPIDLGIAINQGTTLFLSRAVLDHDDVGLTAERLTSLRLTLYEKSTGEILNSRDHVSVLNDGGGALGAGGLLVLELTPADNAMKTTGGEESHIALLEWTYDTSRRGKGELLFRVRRVPKAALA